MKASGDSVVSIVAVAEHHVIGHVMLSRLAAPFAALALAPVSVVPDHQRGGVGSRLVEEGLKRAREQGWEGVFVLGDPAFYQRFRFRADLASGFSSPYTGPHFMALPMGQGLPASSGRIVHAPAFADL
jgi:putative acetyltransferase